MTESVHQRISRFISFSTQRYNDVAQIESPGQSTLLFQRVLYITILDALSKVAIPQSNNRPRMVEFIRRFSGWEECDRISLPHLARILRINQDPNFNDLRNFVNNLMSSWMRGEVITLDRDPSSEDVTSLWPRKEDRLRPLGKVKPESLQHVHLFYNHRNSLIHEFRMLGMLGGAPDWSFSEPYYSVLIMAEKDSDAESERWELQYPIEFYQRITLHAIQSLEGYLIQSSLDPISFYISGSYWVDDLNE